MENQTTQPTADDIKFFSRKYLRDFIENLYTWAINELMKPDYYASSKSMIRRRIMQRRLQIFNKDQIIQKDQTHFLTDLLKDLFADKPSRQI